MPPPTDSRRRSRVESESLASSSLASKRPKIDPSPLSIPPAGWAFGNMGFNAKGKQPEGMDLHAVESRLAQPAPLQPPFRGTRRLVIKNLRPAPDRAAKLVEHHELTMRELTVAADAMLLGEKPHVPYERVYRGVEDLCRFGNAENLFRMLDDKLKGCVHGAIRSSIAAHTGDDVAVLKAACEEYAGWVSRTTLLRSTFSFLDQTYLLARAQRRLAEIAIVVFRDMLFPSSKSKFKDVGGTDLGLEVVSGMCRLLYLDRIGDERFDSGLFRRGVEMLHVLRAYHHFEVVLVEQSHDYFTSFGADRSALPLKEYVHAYQQLTRKEGERCLRFNLDSATKRAITSAARQLLIEDYSTKLLDGGSVSRLIAEQEVESMRVLFGMLRLAKMQDKLKDPWQGYILSAGTQILDEAKGDELVLRLIQLKHRLEVMARNAFRGHGEFSSLIRSQIAYLIRQRPRGRPNVGEMVAKYMDTLLRGGLKSIPSELLSDVEERKLAERSGKASTGDEDAELDRQLDYALDLFRLLEGKDVFEGFYKRDLARRLLMDRSASLDAERAMLSKLTETCGPDFTKNLERMFKDLDLQKSLMDGYQKYCGIHGEPQSSVDFDAKVLSIASWPTYPVLQVNLPPDLAARIEHYNTYYKSKHDNRFLKWPISLSTCVVRAQFAKGNKDLCVSTQQAVVLMAFNQAPGPKDFLTYSQLQQVTNLQDAELQRTLQSLACAKVRVLIKHPKGREVSSTDTFTVNRAFSHPSTRVKINQIQLRETAQENKETHERVERDRRFETQAAIVRIMKSRKTVTHAELIAAVIDMLRRRGPVEPAAVKREIESLIDKDYLERDGSSYHYVS